jgi:magnesium-transporting ATPase (P-type)
MEKHASFLGTYFNKDTVLRMSVFAKIFSWVVVGIYGVEWLVQVLATLLQISRGFWTGMGVTDVLQSILPLFEQPLRGVVYFVVLQTAAQALLLFMDMEDNTRRAARGIDQI